MILSPGVHAASFRAHPSHDPRGPGGRGPERDGILEQSLRRGGECVREGGKRKQRGRERELCCGRFTIDWLLQAGIIRGWGMYLACVRLIFVSIARVRHVFTMS